MRWLNLIALVAAQSSRTSWGTSFDTGVPGYTAASDVTDAVKGYIDILSSLETKLNAWTGIHVMWLPDSLTSLSTVADRNNQLMRMNNTDQSLLDETEYMLVPLSAAVSDVLKVLQDRAAHFTDKFSINGIAGVGQTFMFGPGMIASIYSRSGFRDRTALKYANSIASDSVDACNLGISPLDTYTPYSLESGADITTASYWESAISSVSAEQAAIGLADWSDSSNTSSDGSSGITGSVTANVGASETDTASAESTSESAGESGSVQSAANTDSTSGSSKGRGDVSAAPSSSESMDSSVQPTSESSNMFSSGPLSETTFQLASVISHSSVSSASSAAPTSNAGTFVHPLFYNALFALL